MPVYEFKCPECGLQGQDVRKLGDTTPPDCPECTAAMKRLFSTFAMQAPFVEHINTQTGLPTHSEKQHRDNLKRLSETQTLRTGIEHNYIPVHPGEAKDVYGITEEGLDSTYREEVRTGKRETKLWL